MKTNDFYLPGLPDFQNIKPEVGTLAKMGYIGCVRLNLKF